MAQDESANNDKLGLRDDADVKEMLEKEGESGEEVVYSEKLVKINRKGKKQDRVLLLTNKAVYNLKPNKYKESLRRVELRFIGMLTLSTQSPEFAIHVPTEYDYHLASKNKETIAQILSELFENDTKGNLLIIESELKHLKDIILTKKLAKFEDQGSKQSHRDLLAQNSNQDPDYDSKED